jgi:phage repressor protein C with HTH and peptisase S24 domain
MNASISDSRGDITCDNKCALTPRQGVFLRPLHHALEVCDTINVGEVTDINEVREALKRAMRAKGAKNKPLAKLAGLGETVVRDFVDKGVEPRVGTLIKIADALEIPASSLFGPQVPVLGNVGAGGSVLFEETDEPDLVDRPPGAVGRLMALRVTGDSMLPVYRDGDIVYVNRDHEGVLPEYLGEECVVHTYDGGTFLKTLANGSERNRFTLRSFNAGDMENVELIWATPVLFVMRRRKHPPIKSV